jgi:glycosyltransferase involved in cell wall biosynthesis
MHVGFVSQYVYPHDEEVRIAKYAATLVQAGHRVSVFSRGAPDSVLTERGMGVAIHRFRTVHGPVWLQRLLTNTLPFNGLWVAWLWWSFRHHAVDVAIVRNLRLAFSTLVAARLAGIPVGMDLGENHPALVAALGKQRLAHYVIRNPRLVAWLERFCVRQADHVWVVAEANRRRLASIMHRNEDHRRITVVRNVPLLERSHRTDFGGHREGRKGAGARLVYLGILDSLRGLDMVLLALHALAAQGEPADLVLVGDGPERTRLEALTTDLSLEGRVAFRGWVRGGPAREAELRDADVGLIPHRVCHLTETTQPNKLFDYMLAALPVLSTPLEPVREVLDDVRCGVVAEFSPERFATAVKMLLRDPAERAAMGERGRRAVLERYNWRVESEGFLDSLGALVSR